MFQIETVYSREERERETEREREGGGREGEGGGGADGIRWVDSVICNNGLYIKHNLYLPLAPQFLSLNVPPPHPPTPKNKKMKLTLIDHAGLTSNMNFQNIFPAFQP